MNILLSIIEPYKN